MLRSFSCSVRRQKRNTSCEGPFDTVLVGAFAEQHDVSVPRGVGRLLDIFCLRDPFLGG